MIIAQIHNVFKTLTSTEQRLASFVLKNPDLVVNMTANEFAKACDTVPSAVNRMCKSIGIEGFSKLKISLAGDISQKEPEECVLPFDKDDTTAIIFGKVFNSGIRALKNTYQMLDISKAESISRQILDARCVYLFGVGTSSVVVMDAAYRFSQMGIQAYAYTDILQMNVMAKNMRKGDVAFGVSHSGSTKAVVDAMRSAKESGACTIALTSFSKSLIYTESDYGITVYADEENYPVEAVSARIAHMCVIDSLTMSIASLDYENYSNHIIKRNNALNEIRY